MIHQKKQTNDGKNRSRWEVRSHGWCQNYFCNATIYPWAKFSENIPYCFRAWRYWKLTLISQNLKISYFRVTSTLSVFPVLPCKHAVPNSGKNTTITSLNCTVHRFPSYTACHSVLCLIIDIVWWSCTLNTPRDIVIVYNCY